MLAVLNGNVIGLHREAIGPLRLCDLNLEVGTARAPTVEELRLILSLLPASCRVIRPRKALAADCARREGAHTALAGTAASDAACEVTTSSRSATGAGGPEGERAPDAESDSTELRREGQHAYACERTCVPRVIV